MKRELQVGERVAVYAIGGKRLTGRVVGFFQGDPNCMNVLCDGITAPYCYHPKQCRRLIRRARRRWEGEWSEIYMSDGTPRMVFIVAVGAADLPRIGHRMTLVEARPGKGRK